MSKDRPREEKRPRQETLERSLSQVIEAANRLKRDAPRLIALADSYERGFKANTLGGGGGGESSPTENQALSRQRYYDEETQTWHYPPPDPHHDYAEFFAELKEAMSLVLVCDSHCQALLPKGETEEEAKTAHGVWCVNCIKYEIQKAARPGYGGRCEACWKYRQRNHLNDRPRALVLKDEQRREHVS